MSLDCVYVSRLVNKKIVQRMYCRSVHRTPPDNILLKGGRWGGGEGGPLLIEEILSAENALSRSKEENFEEFGRLQELQFYINDYRYFSGCFCRLFNKYDKR